MERIHRTDQDAPASPDHVRIPDVHVGMLQMFDHHVRYLEGERLRRKQQMVEQRDAGPIADVPNARVSYS